LLHFNHHTNNFYFNPTVQHQALQHSTFSNNKQPSLSNMYFKTALVSVLSLLAANTAMASAVPNAAGQDRIATDPCEYFALAIPRFKVGAVCADLSPWC
jgi:hypothetical protein